MRISLNDGNGGFETGQLIKKLFLKYFENKYHDGRKDAAILPVTSKIAFTTDSYVVEPLFFRGGDIGKLSVCGTVNDLLTSGATPKYISASFILETGLLISELEKIVASMAETAQESNVLIVTGDTKVVNGSGGVLINTAGIGEIVRSPIDFSDIELNDKIILTGNLGDHHAAILSSRLGVENDITSDVAPLVDIISTLLENNIQIKGMRDITRGGLATSLNEISDYIKNKIVIWEDSLPISETVMGFAKMLGLDPLYMGNEGNMLLVIKSDNAEKALDIIRSQKYGVNASVIGEIIEGSNVYIKNNYNLSRRVGMLVGESLPRIC